MKRIYLVSDPKFGALSIEGGSVIYDTIVSMLSKGLQIPTDRFGQEDIEVKSLQLQRLRNHLQGQLEDKLHALDKAKNVDTEIKFLNHRILIDIRNTHHRLFDYGVRLFNIVDGAILKNMSFFVFNLSDLASTDNRILFLLKEEENEQSLNALYDSFIRRFPDFRGLSFQEFEVRVSNLSERKFITVNAKGGRTIISASEKTRKMPILKLYSSNNETNIRPPLSPAYLFFKRNKNA